MNPKEILKREAVVRRGNEVPVVDPTKVVVIGGPERSEGPDKPQTDAYWFAWCPRAELEPTEEFIESIRRPNKVNVPVEVFLDGDKDMVVLAGRRRIKAARIIWRQQEKDNVPVDDRVEVRVIVHQHLDPDAMWQINVSENKDRTNLTVLDRAKQVGYRYQRVGNNAKVAGEFGISAGMVSNFLSVLSLAPKVQDALGVATISLENALKLKDLPYDQQEETLREMITSGKTVGQEAAKVIGAKREKAGVREQNTPRMKSRKALQKFIAVLREHTALADASYVDWVVPLSVRELVVTEECVRYVLGDPTAFQRHPELRALVERLNAAKGKKDDTDDTTHPGAEAA